MKPAKALPDRRTELARSLIEAKRWREVLINARETVRNHSPENCAPAIRAERLVNAAKRIDEIDAVIAAIELDIAALDQPTIQTGNTN